MVRSDGTEGGFDEYCIYCILDENCPIVIFEGRYFFDIPTLVRLPIRGVGECASDVVGKQMKMEKPTTLSLSLSLFKVTNHYPQHCFCFSHKAFRTVASSVHIVYLFKKKKILTSCCCCFPPDGNRVHPPQQPAHQGRGQGAARTNLRRQLDEDCLSCVQGAVSH